MDDGDPQASSPAGLGAGQPIASPAAAALTRFDALPPVDMDFMFGAWRGKGFDSGHRMDGLLEAFGWHGKTFECAQRVHPLVMQRSDGTLFKLDPRWLPLSLARCNRLTVNPVTRWGFAMATRAMETSQPCAHLEMTQYRGKRSATMVYNRRPIRDVFRKLHDDSVLGAMLLQQDVAAGLSPFFFVLERAGRDLI